MTNILDFNELADGALRERFQDCWDELIDNLTDPNVESKAVRKMTITISVKPNGERNFAAVSVVTKASLPPANAIETGIAIGTLRGNPVVSEYQPSALKSAV